MAVDPEFLEHARELLSGLGRLTVKPMFGGASVQLDGAAFALIFRETIYMKVDDETRPAFDAAGAAPFVYTFKDGRAGELGYRTLPESALDDPEDAVRWARLALEAAWRARGRKRKTKARVSRDDIGPGPWDG